MLADLAADLDGVLIPTVEPEELIQRLLQRAPVTSNTSLTGFTPPSRD